MSNFSIDFQKSEIILVLNETRPIIKRYSKEYMYYHCVMDICMYGHVIRMSFLLTEYPVTIISIFSSLTSSSKSIEIRQFPFQLNYQRRQHRLFLFNFTRILCICLAKFFQSIQILFSSLTNSAVIIRFWTSNYGRKLLSFERGTIPCFREYCTLIHFIVDH